MPTIVDRKRDGSIIAVHMNLDRRLWRQFKASVAERGETLTSRIEHLARRDIEESKAQATAS